MMKHIEIVGREQGTLLSANIREGLDAHGLDARVSYPIQIKSLSVDIAEYRCFSSLVSLAFHQHSCSLRKPSVLKKMLIDALSES